MDSLQVNSLINIELTQESGQTSQAPWKHNQVGNMGEFSELIYLKVPSIINNVDNKTIILNELPILLKLSQDKNNLNEFAYVYQFPKKVGNHQFSNILEVENLSNNEIMALENEIKEELIKIYDLDFDLEKFYGFLSEDEKLRPSIDFCKGLRLFIAKDPFECIISSICSANNSILRWTRSIDKIKSNWGEKVEFDDGVFYGFPEPDQFLDFYETPIEEADADGHSYEIDCYSQNLKSCGVGYRAPYMKKASQMLIDDIDINEISSMNYDEAFDLILSLPGVGPKVADCILLYGFGFKEAFPSDVWIKRIVSQLYFDEKEISADNTRDFGIEHFGDYAGYAQLYLFHYARKSGLMDRIKR